ncbi:MAG TPA: hypothetical protein VN806_05565 [Caulobacteraceae bacterium]|nr:hypothetical protein [Caulobacteraceae bacterium]
MRRFPGFAVIIVVIAAVATPSFAQSPPGAGAVRAACAADLSKLCPDAQPGNGSIRQCISTHRDQLSAGCKSALAAAIARRQETQSGAPPHS